jgi:hypothetical protein
MSKPIVRVYSAPGEFEDREMNAQEFAQYEIDQASLAAKKAEADAKAEAKAELLDRLGITDEEAQLLLS